MNKTSTCSRTRLRQLLASVGIALAVAWQAPAGAEDGKLVMNMRDADIRTLIQWVADVTGKNLVVHKDVQGKVTVLSAEPVTTYKLTSDVTLWGLYSHDANTVDNRFVLQVYFYHKL